LGWPWGSLGVALGWLCTPQYMALGWPWGGLGVALVSHWVALCSPLSDFSFQLSAFQLLPNRGFGVPCPPSHESRITSGFRWLCPGFLHSAFCLLPSLLGGFGWFSVTSRVKEQIGAGRQIGPGKQIHPVASRQIRAVLHDQVAAQPAIQRWSGEPGGISQPERPPGAFGKLRFPTRTGRFAVSVCLRPVRCAGRDGRRVSQCALRRAG
jgi:hypothetical protein